MTLIDAYKAAFSRNYPAHDVVVKPKKVRGELRFAVIINQDRGDILLSEEQMQSSIRDFNRGKTL